MKTKHRHQLKENDLAHTVLVVSEALRQNARAIGIGAVVVALAVLIGLGSGMAQRRSEAAADALLAEAMVTLNTEVVPMSAQTAEGLPAAATLGAAGTFASDEDRLNAALPELQATVDAYPDTQAGITARYYLASSLAMLGRNDEAIEQYDGVLAAAGADSLYGRMAQLGRADAAARGGRLDDAVESWQALAEAGGTGSVPLEAVLMELGRAYAARGDMDEARTTFNRVVDEFPASPYSAEARRELDNLSS